MNEHALILCSAVQWSVVVAVFVAAKLGIADSLVTSVVAYLRVVFAHSRDAFNGMTMAEHHQLTETVSSLPSHVFRALVAFLVPRLRSLRQNGFRYLEDVPE